MLFMTARLDVTTNTTEQNLIVLIGKSEATVTKKDYGRDIVLLKQTTYRQTGSIARPLSDSRSSYLSNQVGINVDKVVFKATLTISSTLRLERIVDLISY